MLVGFLEGIERAMPLVVVIRLIAADALTVIAVTAGARMDAGTLVGEMLVYPEVHRPLLQRFCTGDDLDQLLGDLGLAGPVILQRQIVDHLASVARGVVHG